MKSKAMKSAEAFDGFARGVRDLIQIYGSTMMPLDMHFECNGSPGERSISIWLAEPGRRRRMRTLRRHPPKKKRKRTTKAKVKPKAKG